MDLRKKFREVTKEFNVKAKFYNPDSFDDLKNKVTDKQNDLSRKSRE